MEPTKCYKSGITLWVVYNTHESNVTFEMVLGGVNDIHDYNFWKFKLLQFEILFIIDNNIFDTTLTKVLTVRQSVVHCKKYSFQLYVPWPPS